MTYLQHLVSFVHTAEHGSFSAAARVLGLTPAGVSKNVARLEADLGARLFHRSTRRLALTESGERFLQQVNDPLTSLQAAISSVQRGDEAPAGTLKVSMGQAFGRHFLVPLLGDFLARYPAVLPDWHFDNRQVDIVGEGFDAAIGGGFELAPGVVARELAPVHIVAVASPGYLGGRQAPRTPEDLAAFDGIMRRSSPTGRVRPWTLRTKRHAEQAVPCKPRLIFSDPEAIAEAAKLGLGVALLPMPFAFAPIASGELVRLLPGWYSDAGPLSLYYPSRSQLPAKTRAFVDFVTERFRAAEFAKLVDGR
ncbi:MULTISPECIES: LysR family transcriptional regulator [unclassified Rhizobacter]|uniref:LysR family transcriptional regulator n=1 Tax=unclassified Rhizobacter TaxID=2640088 RepID=UPI0006F1D979|nr:MULTISPECIES: LysR family transcriptional regulator [unclassified Rhizobacter]KQU80985.1 LysR family transcriptional regulator [Rhizobacter sp. Root29]KQW04529.1 LysR family transcriptional regulator [Rhizobacter sp. Root1238]KRB06371.1 LysR family transcriptional regulator [Rhizobacter sp. Root16D2]